MYQLISDFCGSRRENGLVLIDQPTGSGKTFNVIKYIYDASIDEANKGRKIFFITGQKKNLPEKDLRSYFEKDGKAELFREKYLFLNASGECVVSNYDSDVANKIPMSIKKTDEYQAFIRDVAFLQEAECKNDLKNFKAEISDKLSRFTWPNFYRMVQGLLARNFNTPEKRIEAIKTDSDWQWLGKLYPPVFMREKQIIFLSMDKFLAKNVTLVEPAYTFYSSSVIDNALIFIDEFDATKDIILKNLIGESLKNRIDYLEMFGQIYASLSTVEFPAVLTTPSKRRREGKYSGQSLQSVIDGIKEKADDIYKEFSLQFNHRTDFSGEADSRNFLFQDHRFHSILWDGKQYVSIESDGENRLNSIRFTETKPLSSNASVQVLLGNLGGFASWFQRAVYILAENYRQLKQERHTEGSESFTLESAIESVLHTFKLNEKYVNFFTAQILLSNRKPRGGIANADFDLSFYEKGFRYYAFEDDSAHDMQSRIMMCSFQDTPEKILLKICERAKVVGISATSSIDTVVGNYDLSYIRLKMQDAFMKISPEDSMRMEEEFHQSQNEYDGIQIHTKFLGTDDDAAYGPELWNTLYGDMEISRHIHDRIQTSLPDSMDSSNYKKLRYFRIGEAYKEFLTHDDIYSFLCVLNKHPKKWDNDLNMDILDDIFKCLGAVLKPSFRTEGSVRFLNGDEYEKTLEAIKNELSSGLKLFVISVYQTVGAGQNIQYTAPATLEPGLMRINDRHPAEKDFDAIYLDDPTNLTVSFTTGQPVEPEDFVKALFQYEELQEAGELSPADTARCVKRAFRHYMYDGQIKEAMLSLKNRRSIRTLATRHVIQAVGRICRASLKNRNIYIFADKKLAQVLDTTVAEGRTLNYEMLALFQAAKEAGNKDPEIRSLEQRSSLTAVRTSREIRNMLLDRWNEQKMEKWKQLRELALRFPVMSREQAEKCPASGSYYIQLPSASDHYYYTQDQDYGNIDVSFSQDADHRAAVSEEGTRLGKLMEYSFIHDYFEAEGYATSFAAGEYMMSPAMWNNIYKGALGEVTGRFLFRYVAGIDLEEIMDPELFELFDFRVKDLPVYVDFKNWNENLDHHQELATQVNKIRNKAEQCRCKCAIVANIYADLGWEISEKEILGVKIVTIPALLTNNGPDGICSTAWIKIKEILDKYGNKNQ